MSTAFLSEAFLHGYLQLASLLPDNIVDDYASDVSVVNRLLLLLFFSKPA